MIEVEYETIKFDSIFDIGEHVYTLHSKNVKRTRNGTESTAPNSLFYGNWNINNAIECAKSGGTWLEGTEAMPVIEIPHETLTGRPLPTAYISTEIQGFAPNVPNFLTGVPDSMLDFNENLAGDKMLRVAVHVGRYGQCTQKSILNRGSAIMAVLEQLSLEGYAIELTAIWRNSNKKQGASIETIIKHSTDHWAPNSVAFALCHAAFQRRLCWRVAESMGSVGSAITANSYGSGMEAKFDDYDIAFGYVNASVDSNLTSPEQAVKYIKNSTIKQLATLTN